LTVRDNHVWLKTLSGLERVDVILPPRGRRFLRPARIAQRLHARRAGLVEALRAGNVTVANALGSGLLQSPAFMSFLPGLCKHLLGEELKLPSVATWWCGQKTAQTPRPRPSRQLVISRRSAVTRKLWMWKNP